MAHKRLNSMNYSFCDVSSFDVWIPYYPYFQGYSYDSVPVERAPIWPPPISFSRIRSHLCRVLHSLGFKVSHSSIYNPLDAENIPNVILVSSLSTSRYSILRGRKVTFDLQALRLLSTNSKFNIFYGVTEGPIANPPNNCHIIVPSKYVAEECERINLKYETIIPLGFDPHQFRLDPVNVDRFRTIFPLGKTIFYSIATGTARNKGLPELFAAIRYVKREIGDKFLVYLRTQKNACLANQMKDIADVTYPIFTAFNNGSYAPASSHQIALEMMSSDCYLVHSLSEGFCMPALEAAFGCGKPIIYPNISPYTDYLTEASGYPVDIIQEEIANSPVDEESKEIEPWVFFESFRLKYWNTNQFAEAMIRVILNKQEAQRKGKFSYENREKWSIFSTYRAFLDLLAH
jgi:glycosyltransferase involved in cell wall biosynthesis